MAHRMARWQFIATNPPSLPQKAVNSKGILPKMAETFRLRIYNWIINCPDRMHCMVYLPTFGCIASAFRLIKWSDM